MGSGEVSVLEKMLCEECKVEVGERMIKLHRKVEHFGDKLEESEDIIINSKGVKSLGKRYTINRCLINVFGASVTFPFSKNCHLVNRGFK